MKHRIKFLQKTKQKKIKKNVYKLKKYNFIIKTRKKNKKNNNKRAKKKEEIILF